MRPQFAAALRCPHCQGHLELETRASRAERTSEGALRSACGRRFPVIAGVPRILPEDLASTLLEAHPRFFARHPDLRPPAGAAVRRTALRTLRSFGDEWTRYPQLLDVHERIFHWYFEGPEPIRWQGRRVLDAGCGMGRWLHYAASAGAEVVGVDVSPAVDVAAARDGDRADFVQADLAWLPLAPRGFDLVYSLGVLHHLEEPAAALRALAALVRPGGEVRLYLYRSLEDEGWMRRGLLGVVTAVRRLTTRLPFAAVHAFSWAVAAAATAGFLLPRRALRRFPAGERLTRGLPLVQYTDVPFGMLVAEQFDRFSAPLERRHGRDDVEALLREAGLEPVALLSGLGWRAIARRPPAAQAPRS
jgi:SAM-dependent methyltransferase/uncharacterized protein YbaR (Trm112 family)